MNIIREARKHLKLTQAELAGKLGVAANTLARWERGEVEPEHPQMLELALFGLKIKLRDVKTRAKIRKIETEIRAINKRTDKTLKRMNA